MSRLGGPGCDSFEGKWCSEHGEELPGEECYRTLGGNYNNASYPKPIDCQENNQLYTDIDPTPEQGSFRVGDCCEDGCYKKVQCWECLRCRFHCPRLSHKPPPCPKPGRGPAHWRE